MKRTLSTVEVVTYTLSKEEVIKAVLRGDSKTNKGETLFEGHPCGVDGIADEVTVTYEYTAEKEPK